MGKTISIKVLFGIYLLLMAGKVFAFSCNVDGGSSIGAGTTSVYVNLDGNDSNLLIVFYVQIMPDDFVMQLHR
ncbi:hypothetical protein OU569_23715, partial [Escherichia coli]|nr:hypothetical protein [Escherichia coli]MDF8762257.1 hypothetical protein [Escherichia coli]MDF8791051.1 hypothetical protein [Escherichia coli]